MDIRQLEAYVYTVKYRSFSLAAQKLYLSQPTVSAHICNLEKELHTQLLKRTTKTLSVTPAGQTLYQYAAEILDLRHKAVLALSNEQIKNVAPEYPTTSAITDFSGNYTARAHTFSIGVGFSF